MTNIANTIVPVISYHGCYLLLELWLDLIKSRERQLQLPWWMPIHPFLWTSHKCESLYKMATYKKANVLLPCLMFHVSHYKAWSASTGDCCLQSMGQHAVDISWEKNFLFCRTSYLLDCQVWMINDSDKVLSSFLRKRHFHYFILFCIPIGYF